MGGANGSRECAPDDKLRNTHQLHLMEMMGFAGSTHSTYLLSIAKYMKRARTTTMSASPNVVEKARHSAASGGCGIGGHLIFRVGSSQAQKQSMGLHPSGHQV
jgi:hypothetical protein